MLYFLKVAYECARLLQIKLEQDALYGFARVILADVVLVHLELQFDHEQRLHDALRARRAHHKLHIVVVVNQRLVRALRV